MDLEKAKSICREFIDIVNNEKYIKFHSVLKEDAEATKLIINEVERLNYKNVINEMHTNRLYSMLREADLKTDNTNKMLNIAIRMFLENNKKKVNSSNIQEVRRHIKTKLNKKGKERLI